MIRVGIFGAGQIGQAVFRMVANLGAGIEAFVIDSNPNNLEKIPELFVSSRQTANLAEATIDNLFRVLASQHTTHVINAMPFSFNEKIAEAASRAKCHYIDFTEDDIMADKVQSIYKDTGLTCAVKCGLAPGFINYIGYDLANSLKSPQSLMISVGALPRTVSYDLNHPENSYNLTWSVDGLVNEYIRPCRIRKNNRLMEIPALGGLSKVIIDGFEYEAAFTSGGVGSLARDLVNVPNVCYMTLRYPGHYRYIREVVQETHGNFNKLKSIFLDKFPSTDDDVIVVYATTTGKDDFGNLQRRSYSNKFYGVDGLTGIQSTTAGSGVAMLELILAGKLQGIVDHPTVNLAEFMTTETFKKYYKTSK
jgi:saccharopine dehydrogenase-like NADP-dependent oxidoreductase